MKHRAKLHVGLLVVVPLFSGQMLAHSKVSTSLKSIHSPLLVTQQVSEVHNHAESASDSLKVVVYKGIATAGGGTAPAGPPINPAETHVFKSGERIVVSFTPNFEGYIYFINRGPEGTRVIFPVKLTDIRATLPNETRNQPLKFNDQEGQEELIVVVSRDRLKELDDAIAKPNKTLGAGTDSSPAGAALDGRHEHTRVAHPPRTIRRGEKTYRVFDKSGLIAANPSRWTVVENISSPAAGAPTSSSRGLECLQEEGDSSVQVRPVVDEKGSYRFGPGQVGAFSMFFDHR